MRKEVKIISIITFFILLGFLILAFSVGNYEFIVYWIILVLLFLLVIKLDPKYKFPITGIVLFSIWSIAHMGGGLIKLGGVKLYDTILINLVGDPFFILKYDQVIHAFAYFAFSILVYGAMKKYFNKKGTALILFAILASLGIGMLNEVIEFGLVVFADAGDAVGGYYNTALDLVFNTIGSILGVLFAKKYLDK